MAIIQILASEPSFEHVGEINTKHYPLPWNAEDKVEILSKIYDYVIKAEKNAANVWEDPDIDYGDE